MRNRFRPSAWHQRGRDASATLLPALALLLACALLAACGEGKRVAGGGSDIGNGSAIAGTALQSDGTAARGALVRLRPSGYLAPVPAGIRKAAGIPKNAGTADTAKAQDSLGDTRADADGRFAFAHIRPGTYRIEIADSSAGAGALVDCKVDSSVKAVELSEARLAATGSVRIHAPPGSLAGAFGYVRIHGLERVARLVGGADLVIDRLPAGTYDLSTVSADPELSTVNAQGVQVKPGAGTDVDASISKCGDRACDSLVLVSFLRANGMDTAIGRYANGNGRVTDVLFAWLDNKVRFRTIGKLQRLSLTSMKVEGPYLPDSLMTPFLEALSGMETLTILSLSWSKDSAFTAIPPAIGKLTGLKMLYIMGDSITALPAEIGDLKNLGMLFLMQNSLAEIPASIGQLPVLTELYLSANRLSALPAAIYGLPKLIKMDVFGNRLCALADTEKAWLTAHDAYPGPDGQTCP
ncbi:MAG: leucine rich repeat domain containing protein [Fibrobacteres bacterium]|nr:leucine rich repeat domain containing protein [Fibrobacterota bacterium]